MAAMSASTLEASAARALGIEDGSHGRPRREEYASYLGLTAHERDVAYFYNAGFIIGRQEALQRRFGDFPER